MTVAMPFSMITGVFFNFGRGVFLSMFREVLRFRGFTGNNLADFPEKIWRIFQKLIFLFCLKKIQFMHTVFHDAFLDNRKLYLSL